jgi:hypothetical protein
VVPSALAFFAPWCLEVDGVTGFQKCQLGNVKLSLLSVKVHLLYVGCREHLLVHIVETFDDLFCVFVCLKLSQDYNFSFVHSRNCTFLSSRYFIFAATSGQAHADGGLMLCQDFCFCFVYHPQLGSAKTLTEVLERFCFWSPVLGRSTSILHQLPLLCCLEFGRNLLQLVDGTLHHELVPGEIGVRCLVAAQVFYYILSLVFAPLSFGGLEVAAR